MEKMKSKINLHIHSNDSLDGKENMETVLDRCEEQGLEIVSITDHNTTDAYFNLQNTKFSGKLIAGMEADAMIGTKTYDILCFDFKLEEVSSWTKDQYKTVDVRQQKIFNKLLEKCENIGIEVPNTNSYNAKTEYAHGALFRLLKETKKENSFLNKYDIKTQGDLYRLGTMNEEFPLYIDMHLVWPGIEELREIIHKNGGKLFLAHPFRYGKNEIENILENCLPYIDGIEISNNSKTKEEIIYLYNYAKNHDLLISAGSDYHGEEDYHNKLAVEGLEEQMEQEIYSWTKNCKNLIKK